MIPIVIFIGGAFEYSIPAGPATAMIAGCPLADWQHALILNPALAVESPRTGFGIIVSRPYNLEGVTAGRIAAARNYGRWALVAGCAQTASGRYRESDLQIDLAARLLPLLGTGFGVHALIQDTGINGIDAIPAFDIGLCYGTNRIRFGAALLRVNEPKLKNGDAIPWQFTAGVAWRPVETFALVADVLRTAAIESFRFGMEFSLTPQLTLRSGMETDPLRYAGGIEASIGPVGCDYSYQFHPALKESHLLGLTLVWR